MKDFNSVAKSVLDATKGTDTATTGRDVQKSDLKYLVSRRDKHTHMLPRGGKGIRVLNLEGHGQGIWILKLPGKSQGIWILKLPDDSQGFRVLSC